MRRSESEGLRIKTMKQDLVAENIKKLIPYRPGKPIEEVEREFGLTNVIKLASNENPLGASPAAMLAMHEAIEKVALYPDGLCYYLARDLAKHWGVGEENLIFGNGSDDIIHYIGLTFLQPGDEVLQGSITFSRYESAATLNGAPVINVPMKEMGFDLDAIAERFTPRTKLVFIANPNNPTGSMATAAEVARFMDRLPERAIAIFDEAYYEYVESADYPDTLKYVRDGRNVIVLRTFSKIYGLAGLRIGYGIGRKDLIDYLHQVREPFNVNTIAQAAARASLADSEQVARSRKMNSDGKRYLYGEFDRMGLKYVPSEANFVLVDLGVDSVKVFKSLLAKGVIVRTGDVFGIPTWVRVTIGTADENRRFVAELEKVLAAQ